MVADALAPHIGSGPIRVMQLYAVVMIDGLYWLCFVDDQTEPGNSRRIKIFAWTLNLVMVPAVIVAHLATVR